jgi:imidazolonepropionase-like amidohydrolase
MKNLKYIIICLLSVFCNGIWAQNPKAGKPNNELMVFANSVINIGNGQIINNGSLVIKNGLIVEVALGNLSNKYPGAKIIDVMGKQIFPGIISPNNSLGLVEIEAVRTTQDVEEIGQFNPNVRTLVAFNTDSEVIPTVRGNGVLISQATPEGGTISGRSSIMYLDGWNWEDAVLKADDGVWLNWPSKMTNSFDMTTFKRELKKNEKYQSTIDEINQFFNQAKTFNSEAKTFDNIKYSALNGLLFKSDRLYINISNNKEALDAIAFCKDQKIKFPVLVGQITSDLVLNLMLENKIPVLIPTTHRIPEKTDADNWEAYNLANKLFEKGLLVGMYYNASYWRTRNLPFSAGNAAGHGLSKTDALKMVTLNNAKIMGIDNVVGSLEAGKHATFVISEGDILDMMTSKITHAFIKGSSVDLDDKQKRLAKKYNEKYGLD